MLDKATVQRISRTATLLGMAKSSLVRDAVAQYATRADRLSEAERRRMLDALDGLLAKPVARPCKAAAREIAAIRRARRTRNRGTPMGAQGLEPRTSAV